MRGGWEQNVFVSKRASFDNKFIKKRLGARESVI